MKPQQAIYERMNNTELSLDNEQTAGEKCSRGRANALQFRTNRMRIHTPNPKRDFDSTGRNTPLRGYCGVAR